MAEYQDNIKYKVVVDPSEAQRTVQRATDEANRRQKSRGQAGGTSGNSAPTPSTPRDRPPGTGHGRPREDREGEEPGGTGPRRVVEQMFRRYFPVITNAGQMAWGVRGTWLSTQRLAGSVLATNPTAILRNSIGAAGGVGHVLAGGVGLGVGGAAGMAVGGGLGLLVTALTKGMTGLVDVTDKLSSTFSHYNAGIAASQAMVNVAMIQNNLKLAKATEPIILAFNKLKIAAIGTAEGLIERLANRFGPALTGLFDKLDDWIKQVAGHFGINLGANVGPFEPKSLSNAFLAAGRGGTMTAGEMARSLVGGTLFGGAVSGGRQKELLRQLLHQREVVRAVHETAAGHNLPTDQANYVRQEERRLSQLERRYADVRKSSDRRYAGRGVPLGGVPPLVKALEGGNFPQTRSDDIEIAESKVKHYTDLLNKPLDDPFWKDPANDKPLDWSGIQRKRAEHSKLLDEARTQLFKLRQKPVSTYVPDPALAAHQKAFNQAYSARTVAQRELDSLESINPARRGMKTMEKIEELRATVNNLSRREKQEGAELDALHKKHVRETKAAPVAPFSAIDIRQSVSFKLDMKIAHEKQIHEAMSAVRKELFAGFNQANNETRLALAAQNIDRTAVL